MNPVITKISALILASLGLGLVVYSNKKGENKKSNITDKAPLPDINKLNKKPEVKEELPEVKEEVPEEKEEKEEVPEEKGILN